MKTHTQLTSLFLLLLVRCSNSVEPTTMEVVVSHIAGAESAEKQQEYKSDESLTESQWPEAVLTADSLQDSEDSVVELPTAIVDHGADVAGEPEHADTNGAITSHLRHGYVSKAVSAEGDVCEHLLQG